MALAGMAALAVPMGIGRFAFTPILPMMQVDAGLSVAAGGWLASANYAGTLAGALAAMTLRVPVPAAVRGGLLAIGLTTLAMAAERRFASWLALRALAGIATAWVLVFASAWALERLEPLRRPALNSTLFAGYGVGIAGAGGVCLALMQAQAGSAQAWASLGVLALAVTALVWPVFGDDHAASGPRRPPPGRGHCWDADSARVVLCYGAFGFGYIVPATFLPVMARQAFPDPAVFGWSWPVFGAAAAGSTFAAAGLSALLDNRRLWSLGHVVLAAGVVLPVLWPGIVAVMLSALLVGAMFTVTTMAGFQEGRRVGGAHAKELIGALASAFAVGQIVALVGVSYLVRADGGLSGALVVACLVLLASAGALAVRRP
ncbi:MAG TPA: YbfB/YjiJ family MFS transporter [Methylomirabilota bacterium]|nr:YbfB/YjiJ family MFS transporter [Methylomirabilota bacterium]